MTTRNCLHFIEKIDRYNKFDEKEREKEGGKNDVISRSETTRSHARVSPGNYRSIYTCIYIPSWKCIKLGGWISSSARTAAPMYTGMCDCFRVSSKNESSLIAKRERELRRRNERLYDCVAVQGFIKLELWNLHQFLKSSITCYFSKHLLFSQNSPIKKIYIR